MLAIHHRLLDRVKNVKAITAGVIAFGVGLTAAAAYVGATTVYDNFSYEFADRKASAKVAGASTSAEIKAEDGQLGIPGSGASGSTGGSSSGITTQNGSGGVSTLPSTGAVGTAPVVGGRGAGAPTVTEPTSDSVEIVPAAPDPTNCLCNVIAPVTNTVNGVSDGLGL